MGELLVGKGRPGRYPRKDAASKTKTHDSPTTAASAFVQQVARARDIPGCSSPFCRSRSNGPTRYADLLQNSEERGKRPDYAARFIQRELGNRCDDNSVRHSFCNTPRAVNNDVQVGAAEGSHHVPNRWPWPTRWACTGTSCSQGRGGYTAGSGRRVPSSSRLRGPCGDVAVTPRLPTPGGKNFRTRPR